MSLQDIENVYVRMGDAYDKYRTHHTSRRLRGYSYTRPAAYFVTVCTKDRVCLFGEITDGQMRLNEIGQIVDEEWRRSEALREEVTLDVHVVMPNHVHGVVVIAPSDGEVDPHGYDLMPGDRGSDMARHVATSSKPQFGNPEAGSLGTIVGAFKSAATRRINASRNTPGATVWQRNYHDRILRDEDEWRRCRQYIETNPARWIEDENHPTRL